MSFSHRDLPSEEGRPSVAVAFRALLPSRIRCFRFAVTLARGPLLSWDSSSLGFSLSSPWRVLPPSSPLALGSRSAEASRLPGLQGFTLRGAWLVSEETADPSEVSHLVKLAISWKGFKDRDYEFSSGPVIRRRLTAGHLWSLPPLCRSPMGTPFGDSLDRSILTAF
jgi:hypothetical protein